jgi:hypothetical protein
MIHEPRKTHVPGNIHLEVEASGNLPTSFRAKRARGTLSYYNCRPKTRAPRHNDEELTSIDGSSAGRLHNSLWLSRQFNNPITCADVLLMFYKSPTELVQVVQLKIPEHIDRGFPESVEQVNNASVALDDLGNV